MAMVKEFVRGFVAAYRGHGGKVITDVPAFHEDTRIAEGVTQIWNAVGAGQKRAQMLMIVLPDANSFTYQRIKKSCECRYGVVSQCTFHWADEGPLI